MEEQINEVVETETPEVEVEANEEVVEGTSVEVVDETPNEQPVEVSVVE